LLTASPAQTWTMLWKSCGKKTDTTSSVNCVAVLCPTPVCVSQWLSTVAIVRMLQVVFTPDSCFLSFFFIVKFNKTSQI
jgi:hypothetical protein